MGPRRSVTLVRQRHTILLLRPT